LGFTVIAVAVIPMTVINGSRLMAAPALDFKGAPHRWTVGRAVSHGCVRLLNENVRTLYGQVKVGTPVTVLP
jgi:lipoprotein-anchoring transpeptidase ErfK/SrfK